MLTPETVAVAVAMAVAVVVVAVVVVVVARCPLRDRYVLRPVDVLVVDYAL